jgi:tetratricopeptide (TPR) repeat protein
VSKGLAFDDLLASSKLLFLRGDVLGSIADHDRAECVANEAVAMSPETASALYAGAQLAERFHRFDEANALLDRALSEGCPTREVDLEKAALLQGDRDGMTRRWFCVRAWRRTIRGFTLSGRSRPCWRRWTDGRRPNPATRPLEADFGISNLLCRSVSDDRARLARLATETTGEQSQTPGYRRVGASYQITTTCPT